ncbi:glycosyl transferase, partial [Caldanaerobacter subterraneus]|uniref:glycosyltransferase n=1 Tax=Caldanaerobacter subterraneus TaxID=911092 RepID=UPI0004CFD64A
MEAKLEKETRKPTKHKVYISVMHKFLISQMTAISWMIFSIKLSVPWLNDLSKVVGFPLALFIITFIAYVPGYLVSFTAISLLLDRQPSIKGIHPSIPVTILIAARNEAERIATTLRYVANQEYNGQIHVVIVDNNS